MKRLTYSLKQRCKFAAIVNLCLQLSWYPPNLQVDLFSGHCLGGGGGGVRYFCWGLLFVCLFRFVLPTKLKLEDHAFSSAV